MSARKSKKTGPRPSGHRVQVQEVESRSQEASNMLVISYMTLRKAVGVLGMALPFVLILGGLIFYKTGVQGSLSAYYHTGMRDVFVGFLWVIGIFLYSYKGYEGAKEKGITGIINDNVAGNLACVFAIGVAIFPTWINEERTLPNPATGYAHLVFAALFFLTLSYFCLFLFTKTHKNSIVQKGSNKMKRNTIYRVCGILMLVCIALMGVYNIYPASSTAFLDPIRPTFTLETVAILAFGFSWLIKGETLLKD